MTKCRFTVNTLVLALGLGTFTSQLAQTPSAGVQQEAAERRAVILGLVRTINTIEATDFNRNNSYESWPQLLEHHAEDLRGWLEKFYPGGTQAHFADLPEILPGYKLRLNVNPDGKGYVVLVEDAKDKAGFAAVSDERGKIRDCQYLR